MAAALFLFHSATGLVAAPYAVSTHPANVFLAGETCKFDGLAKGAAWSVVDWQARVVTSGTVASGTALIAPVLSVGYYRLNVTSGTTKTSVPFAVVVNPASRVADPSSPYAVDTAQAWQAGSVVNKDLNAAAELTRLAGVPQARDRFSWKDTNPSRGSYNWGRYASSVPALTARGVQVLDVFSGSPAWTRAATDDLPSDQLALYDWAKAAGQKFTGAVTAWEFWNEPDLTSCSDPAWEFATSQKVAYLGFKAGAPNSKVLLGSNAVTPIPRFFEVALENGLGAGFDIFNFHLYDNENNVPSIVDDKAGVLARYGLGGKPMWATEVGTLKSEIGGAAPIVSPNREHSEAQERAQAEHVVKTLLTLHAERVQRSFYFMLLPYNENNGQKPWGLLRWDWTVKPGYCALANLTALLANHDVVGKLNITGVDAYVLEKRGQPAATRKQTVVFWAAGNPVNVTSTWARGAQLTDLMGTPRTLSMSGSDPVLQASSSPQFLTNVAPQGNPVPAVTTPAAGPVQNVVYGLSLADPAIVVNRTALNLPAAGTQAWLKIWNFSTGAQTVAVVNSSSGVTVSGLPASTTVPARSSVMLPMTLVPAGAGIAEPKLKITGTSGGQPVAPLVAPARPTASAFNAARVAISNTGLWRKNSSGTLTTAGDAATNAMKFTTTFKANTDWWVYPALNLKNAGVSLAKSAGISFDIKAEGSSVNLKKAYAIIKTSTNSYEIPIWIGTTWQNVTLLWDFDAPDFDRNTAIELQIGANSQQNPLIYTVRGMTVLTAK